MEEISAENTELIEARKQVQDLKEQLDKFYNIISLELGSPLKSLKSMVDLVQMDMESIDNPSATESVRYLNLQMEKLLFQMSNLIEWSSLQVKNYAYRPESFDIQQVLASVGAFYEKQATAKGIILTHDETLKINAVGDKRMIRQAVSNFVSNSVKFCKKGDTITLGIENLEGKLWVVIKDTGIGMGKAKLQNVFNPSRKSTQKGTSNESGLGLGMITAKAILDLHESELQIVSEQGKGTTIRFSLAAE
ncbi:MAG: sensor histidine kinase [Cytophagales bacterium]|nr:MAG: sensor histidine kinase [Cytophagales bacterium]